MAVCPTIRNPNVFSVGVSGVREAFLKRSGYGAGITSGSAAKKTDYRDGV
jgi:hypothetical protein